jgi:hypothetical protein
VRWWERRPEREPPPHAAESGSITPFIRRRHADANASPEPNILTRPVPEEPGAFRQGRIIGDFVVLDWATGYGIIGWAHSLKTSSPPAHWLTEAVFRQFRDRMHKVYAAFVLPQGALNLDLAPVLKAVDLYPDAGLSDTYDVTWRQMTVVLGTRPLWFHPALRDRDTICSWKPGNIPAIIPANHVESPTRVLLDLAADEPDGSPSAAACLWLARRMRRQDALAAQQSVDEIRVAAGDPDSDCMMCTSPRFPLRCCGPRTPSQRRWSSVPGGRRSSNGAMCWPQPPPGRRGTGTAGKPGRSGGPHSSIPRPAPPRPSGPPACTLLPTASPRPSWNATC